MEEELFRRNLDLVVLPNSPVLSRGLPNGVLVLDPKLRFDYPEDEVLRMIARELGHYALQHHVELVLCFIAISISFIENF